MSEETLLSPIAGEEMTVGPATLEPEPLSNPSLANLMLTCPRTWQGDTGMLNWVTSIYNGGLGSVPQTSPPTLTKVQPSHVPANANATVTLTGTGFDPATVKVQIIATQITPNPTPTSTSLTAVIPAASIPTSGSLVQLSAVNGTGAISNALNLYLD
jgi:hypothetical protein